MLGDSSMAMRGSILLRIGQRHFYFLGLGILVLYIRTRRFPVFSRGPRSNRYPINDVDFRRLTNAHVIKDSLKQSILWLKSPVKNWLKSSLGPRSFPRCVQTTIRLQNSDHFSFQNWSKIDPNSMESRKYRFQNQIWIRCHFLFDFWPNFDHLWY